jgi:tetratricopeptide (TPR) repeat protein
MAATVAVAMTCGLTAGADEARAGNSLAGAYLAGLHAIQRQDHEAAATYFAEAARRDPGNGLLLEQAMLNQALAGRMDPAARSAERLVALASDHRLANMLLAARDFRRGGHAAVLDRLERRADSFHPLLRSLMTAWAAEGAGRPADADAALDGLGAEGLEGAMAGYHRALLLLHRDQPEAALAEITRLEAALGVGSNGITLAKGFAQRQLGDDAAAAETYAALAAEPAVGAALARLEAGLPAEPPITEVEHGVAEALYTFASVMSREGDGRGAIAHGRLATYLRPDFPSATLLIASRFAANDQHALAASALEAIPEGSPYAVRAETARAEALEALDRREDAIGLIRALRDGHPDDPAVLLTLGDLLRRAEDWEPCADAYTAAVDILAPEDRVGWALLYQRAICYERAGLWDLAEADFLAALEMEPDQPFVLNYLGYSWVEKRRHLDEAQAMIERAVEQEPDNGYIVDSLGWVLYRLEDYEGAVEWLEKAVALEPDDPTINDHLGDALWMVGRRNEARFQWLRARSFEPEDDVLARIRRKLDVGLDVVKAEERAEAQAEAPTAASAPDAEPAPADGG